ncbi:Spc19-domain-containing protein [Auriculariales sp. MPI-PUGE-AT-0066]|nr:Spc19-domain-containing protein [Auriculariales sp. MPI-PUGE-AT-0066]
MSVRASTASFLRPRDSVYPGGTLPRSTQQQHAFDFAAQLHNSISLMEDCTDHIATVNEQLADGGKDLPRLARVLKNTRMHAMANEQTIHAYKTQMAEEMDPQISELRQRGLAELDTLKKRRDNLRRKADLRTSTTTTANAAGTEKAEAKAKAEAKRMTQIATLNAKLAAEIRDLEEEERQLEEQLTALQRQ